MIFIFIAVWPRLFAPPALLKTVTEPASAQDPSLSAAYDSPALHHPPLALDPEGCETLSPKLSAVVSHMLLSNGNLPLTKQSLDLQSPTI